MKEVKPRMYKLTGLMVSAQLQIDQSGSEPWLGSSARHFSLTVPQNLHQSICIHKMGTGQFNAGSRGRGIITGKQQPDRPLGSCTDFTLLVN